MLLKHYLGLPCMLGETVGRIVGEHEIGSWAEINGEKLFSVPLFSTPHGTVVKTGRAYLSEITEEGMIKLLAYEKELADEEKILYAGKLPHIFNIKPNYPPIAPIGDASDLHVVLFGRPFCLQQIHTKHIIGI